jgi:hypothetical protein
LAVPTMHFYFPNIVTATLRKLRTDSTVDSI